MNTTEKMRHLYRQIDDQANLIEDLKEIIRSHEKTITSQNATLREIGFMTAHCFQGKLNSLFKIQETRMGLN